MRTIAAALAVEYPETNKGSDVQLVALAERVVGNMAPTLTVLAGAVTLLLLIACVNLASLLLNKTALHDLDRTIPVFNDRTVDQVMGEALLTVVTLLACYMPARSATESIHWKLCERSK